MPSKLEAFHQFDKLSQLEQSTVLKVEASNFASAKEKGLLLANVHQLLLYNILIDRKPSKYFFCPLENTSKSTVAAALDKFMKGIP